MIGGVYIAYPIDQRGPASLSWLFEQIENMKHWLLDSGAVSWVFDPGDAFTVNPKAKPSDGLATINRAALNNSDLVVAFLPAGVPTIGVPIEIDRARAQGKHVLVMSDIQSSWMLEMPGIAKIGGWKAEHIDVAVDWIKRLEPPTQSKQFADLPVKVGSGGVLPTRAYDDDAGLDLVVSERVRIPSGTFRDVPCGVSVSLPGHTWGLVTGRSSALRKRGLLIHSGVIDAGYRGPLFAGAWNMTNYDVDVEKGERIAQLIVIGNSTRYLTPIEVQDLAPSERGTNGFGSTGA